MLVLIHSIQRQINIRQNVSKTVTEDHNVINISQATLPILRTWIIKRSNIAGVLISSNGIILNLHTPECVMRGIFFLANYDANTQCWGRESRLSLTTRCTERYIITMQREIVIHSLCSGLYIRNNAGHFLSRNSWKWPTSVNLLNVFIHQHLF